MSTARVTGPRDCERSVDSHRRRTASRGPVAYDAILLAGFGGPEGQDDVIPFLRNVTRGRGIPDERLEEVAHHYRHFGGVSPINAQNRALEGRRSRRSSPARHRPAASTGATATGRRTSRTRCARPRHPAHDRCSRCRRSALLARSRAAGSTARTSRACSTDTGLAGAVTIDKVRQFFDHPRLRRSPSIRRDGPSGVMLDRAASRGRCRCRLRRSPA